MKTDIAIIGGGAAGLAAALKATGDNIHVLVIEREKDLGGILNQCIHNGFGLQVFKEELTGPEYSTRVIQAFHEQHIQFLAHTTVTEIQKEENFILYASSEEHGLMKIEAKAVILSSGCYERTRGAVQIPGDRPAGIMPAGSAQRYLNIDGYLVGKKVFILGSGDIGLIMARRMTLEGAKVLGVAEIMPYSNGLTRNIVQCLHDFDIPLYLSHTVTNITGKERLETITIQEVDETYQPIPKTEKTFDVDTLLLSVGLIPDTVVLDQLKPVMSPITKSVIVNQFYETSVQGLFVCGNALHVHDLVDWVTKESEKAGMYAKQYVLDTQEKSTHVSSVNPGKNIRYIIPQLIDFDQLVEPIEMLFRVTKKVETGIFKVSQNHQLIKQKKAKYVAPAEMEHLILNPEDFIDQSPITLDFEEVDG